MEEVVPVKIDWKKFKKLFPKESSGWEMELRAGLPDRDLSGFDLAYALAMDAIFPHLPRDFRKSLALFVAATSVHAVDAVDFSGYEIECEYDPEEWMDAALPKLDPRKMTRVAKALNDFQTHDYRGAIREAWRQPKVQSWKIVTERFQTADDFIAYLDAWIAAFNEIHEEGAVLGLAVSM